MTNIGPVVMVTSLMTSLISFGGSPEVSKTTGAAVKVSARDFSNSSLPRHADQQPISRLLVATTIKNVVGKMHVVFDNDPQKWDWSQGEPLTDIYRTTKQSNDDYDDFKPSENLSRNATYSERTGE
jgi:hypothetical protein